MRTQRRFNITVESVYEPPWEREARLLGLNNLPARSYSGLSWTWRVKNQEPQEKTALLGPSSLLQEWLPQRDPEGKKLFVGKSIRNRLVVVPDLQKTPIGARIRFLLTKGEFDRFP